MAARRLIRDARGRFAKAPVPEPDPTRFPTQARPRWRLRVFDQKWPWRAERSFVLDDALACGHASIPDAWSGRICLIVPADIQQDPPPIAAMPRAKSASVSLTNFGMRASAHRGWRR